LVAHPTGKAEVLRPIVAPSQRTPAGLIQINPHEQSAASNGDKMAEEKLRFNNLIVLSHQIIEIVFFIESFLTFALGKCPVSPGGRGCCGGTQSRFGRTE
jgi:hypothetical protein